MLVVFSLEIHDNESTSRTLGFQQPEQLQCLACILIVQILVRVPGSGFRARGYPPLPIPRMVTISPAAGSVVVVALPLRAV